MIAAALAALTLAPSTPHQQVLARYSQWDTAYFAHDVRGPAALLHADFKSVTGSGKTRKDYIASLWKAGPPQVYETEVLNLNATGKRATAWTRERSKFTGDRLSEHRYIETWCLLGGNWKHIQSTTVGDR